MAEQTARVGDIEIAYETFGEPSDPAVLLVMGLATQMIAWHEDFCRELADRGFHVIRFDNRDVGRSTAMRDLPAPSIRQLALRSKKAAGYTLSDMAGDAVGLLDHLGIERAHVVGASMGGMIAQTIAIEHPDRVLSLCSIMSNTGSRWSGQPKLATYRVLLSVQPSDRDDFIQHVLRMYRVIGSPGFDRDEDELHASPRRPSTAVATRTRAPANSPPSTPRATGRRSCGGSTSRRSSSTARRTRWCGPPAAGRPPRRSPARRCSRSRGWGTTCRPRPGRR